jgi:hypothetical protein
MRGLTNLNQLMIFYESAKYLCFSRAGGHLSIGQPAVSSQIKQLKALLRAKLFRRMEERCNSQNQESRLLCMRKRYSISNYPRLLRQEFNPRKVHIIAHHP